MALTWAKSQASSSTATSFTDRVPTGTEPTGTGVTAVTGTVLHVRPFGSDAHGETYKFRVWGWNKLDDSTDMWIPTLIFEGWAIFGDCFGIASAMVINTECFASVLAVAKLENGARVMPHAENKPAELICRIGGFDKFQIDFSVLTATNANALIAQE